MSESVKASCDVCGRLFDDVGEGMVLTVNGRDVVLRHCHEDSCRIAMAFAWELVVDSEPFELWWYRQQVGKSQSVNL